MQGKLNHKDSQIINIVNAYMRITGSTFDEFNEMLHELSIQSVEIEYEQMLIKNSNLPVIQ